MANENIKGEKPVKLDKNGKPKKGLGSKARGLFGELKKVSWPTFSKVISQTLVVLAVTLFFLLVLMAMDVGLQELYKLLVKGLDTGSSFSMVSGKITNGVNNISSAVNSLPIVL